MSEDTESEAMRAAITSVLADQQADHPSGRGIVTGFVVVAEVIGDDGDPWITRICDIGPKWRTIGMLVSVTDDLRDALREAN